MQWILFDVGGVLEIVDDNSWLEKFFGRLGALANLAPDEMRSRLETLALPRIDIAENTEQLHWETVVGAFGLGSTLIPGIRADFWDNYCGAANTELIEYARGLKGRTGLAILSNSVDGAREEEERRFGFSQVFDPICYSHEQGVNKPEPRAYELALERMNARPVDVLFIDDREACLEGAARLGIRTQLHTTNGSTIAAIEEFLGAV